MTDQRATIRLHDEEEGSLARVDAILADSAVYVAGQRADLGRWVHLRSVLKPGDVELIRSHVLAGIRGTAAYGFAHAIDAWIGDATRYTDRWRYQPASIREHLVCGAALLDLGMRLVRSDGPGVWFHVERLEADAPAVELIGASR